MRAPGALTTIQDLGRHGYAHLGVPASGAMDELALRAVNLLVGNPEAAAALEITLSGPTLEFERRAVVAVAGGALDAPLGEAFVVDAGETLALGPVRGGARAVLAVRGGIDVAPVLGSRSTNVTAALGPPPLRAGDDLPVGPARESPLRRLRAGALPEPTDRLRVLADEGLPGGSFTVSTRADRTGIRLEGASRGGPERTLPTGVPRGTIQLPPDGRPIIVCADGPVTGGYAQLGWVCAADVPLLAALRPGDAVRFEPATLQDARAAGTERLRALRGGVIEG